MTCKSGGTDYLIAKSLSEKQRDGQKCCAYRSFPFRVSSHHKQFWGTVFISPAVLRRYIKETCLSVNYYGVRKIVVVNGHGGNLPVLPELARELDRTGCSFPFSNSGMQLLSFCPIFLLSKRGSMQVQKRHQQV